MIINNKLKKDMLNLSNCVDSILNSNSLTEIQIEQFLQKFEKARYNILAEIKLYNNNVEFEYEKIKTIDDGYKATIVDNALKIYIPEALPSFKNVKTHTHKRILLNVAETTKEFKDMFKDKVFILIKIYDKILGWDVDNRFIKPISDALITSGVIKDDNISKMLYSVKGEFSEIPHTEVYVFDGFNSKKIVNFLQKHSI